MKPTFDEKITQLQKALLARGVSMEKAKIVPLYNYRKEYGDGDFVDYVISEQEVN